jgi:hypothetical protein
MHPRLPLLIFALAALLVILTPAGCSDNNNVAGPNPTATPAVSTATPTSPGATATATRTVTPATSATPTRTPTSSASAYAGTWTGTWNNTTFGSSGSASLVDTVNTSAQTFQATLTLGGNVFGAGTPAPQNFSGSYASGTFSQFSPLFGNVTINFTSPGAFTGSATNVPNPNIARVDFTGTATTQTILVNYTITFTSAGGGGTAVGTMTLNHVSA